jgi:heat shock protein HtpX
MNASQLAVRYLQHQAQTWAAVAALGGLVLLTSVAVLGVSAGALSWAAAVLLSFTAGHLSPRTVMRLRGARLLHPLEAPRLHQRIAMFAARAELTPPGIYLSESQEPQAFATGTPSHSAIAVTRGLLDLMDERELEAVLAHELGHVMAGDTGLLLRVRVLRQVLSTTVTFGWVALAFGAFGLPFGMSVLALPVLLSSPILAALLESYLSRSREFQADLRAAQMIGTPRTLTSALRKLQRYQNWLRRCVPGFMAERVPEALRTHPDLERRMEQLDQLLPQNRSPVARPRKWQFGPLPVGASVLSDIRRPLIVLR